MIHDLAQGVFVGVLLSVMFFAYKVSHSFTVEPCLLDCGTKRVYKIIGQVFFASADSFVSIFDYKENISIVVIDLSDAHFWDVSAVDALNKISDKLKKNNIKVEIIGLNAASATIISKVLGHQVENS